MSAPINFDYKKATLDDIANWCDENDPAWYISVVETEENLNFLTLRRKFFEKFAPEKLPVAKAKPLSMKSRAEAMKKKLAGK